MSVWTNIIIVVHILVALAIVGLVLLQHGKGADMGSGFGGGASSSLFGATGSANFLSRTTAVLATVFFLSSLGLAYFATQKPREGAGVMDRAPATQGEKAAEKSAPEKKAAEPQKTVPAPESKQVPQ